MQLRKKCPNIYLDVSQKGGGIKTEGRSEEIIRNYVLNKEISRRCC